MNTLITYFLFILVSIVQSNLDKKQVTITGKVPATAQKIVFTADDKKLSTYFSEDGTGRLLFQVHVVFVLATIR